MAIYVNQVGYETTGYEKKAVVNRVGTYELKSAANEVIWSGKTLGYAAEGVWTQEGNAFEDPLAGENVYVLDFSEVHTEGEYYLEGPTEEETRECSDHFGIRNRVFRDVHDAMIKALYYQRCGCALDEKNAGMYRHKKCHMEPAVVWGEPGKMVAATGGWHDAGDYGRYTTPGAVTVAHLLYAYEMYPNAFEDELNIPESGNGVPDVLNECRYELEWLLKMQCKDGGVYHKLTGWRHCGFIMPEEDKDQFYFYPVSSMAVGDFCAVMAQASRVYAKFDPAFSEKMAVAAWKSYEWLLQHPKPVLFKNPEDSYTGEYGDCSDTDERLWAQAEITLLAAREKKNLSEHVKNTMQGFEKEENITAFGWGNVSGFATLAVYLHGQSLFEQSFVDRLKAEVIKEADALVEVQKKNAFGLCMEPYHFGWGSCLSVTNKGILLALAYDILKGKNPEQIRIYEELVKNHMDYLLGKNASGYSFVTGFGEHAYKYPHLRTTAADGIDDPMPGWVSGGPNIHYKDSLAQQLVPQGTAPMKSYADREECYSLNEITIYWNSSAVFCTAFLLR